MNTDNIVRMMESSGQISTEFANSILTNQSEITRETHIYNNGFTANHIPNRWAIPNESQEMLISSSVTTIGENRDVFGRAIEQLANLDSNQYFYNGTLAPGGITTVPHRHTYGNTSSEQVKLIIDKADLYHIELGEEAKLDSLKAIKTIIDSDSSISDVEIIDNINNFLNKIGI